MTERRIGDESIVVSAATSADAFVAVSVDVSDAAAVVCSAARWAGRGVGRAAGEGLFAPAFAPAAFAPVAVAPEEPVGVVGLRDAAEAPAAAGFARRAAFDRAAAELPPGPRRWGVDGSESGSTGTTYQQDNRATLTRSHAQMT